MNNQMNSAVRKIHNLLSSGAVTVTGPNQPRILKQKIVGSGATATTVTTASLANNVQQQQVVTTTINRCYVCDDALGANQAQHQLTEMQTTHTTTKFPNKIGQLVGDAFMVIVSVEDVVCSRCTNLINYLDRLENDVERVRTNLMNLLHKKYGLNDDSGGIVNATTVVATGTPTIAAANVTNNVSSATLQAPPNKLQKLNSGAAVSAVQQMKISTQSPTNIQQQSAGTQTLQRKTTKIYKCLSCDYKTSDMRLFNTHYETCKHQNFQCKNCKKIFPNFGAMKQHMVREHNTPMDNTCAVCHINFVSESALRKHMEINHSTNVVVTSTTTLPVSQNAAPAADPITAVNAQASPGTTTTPLYTCNHCQFKSTDKITFDEHMRKHMSGVKSKPFKCRLCAQRFETREAATTHAKQHQGNVFKCGTCSMSFPKREMLVKHFEEHQQQQHNTQQLQQQQQQVQQQQQMITIKQQQAPQASQNMLTTQKLLQETIDEALSDSTTPVTTTPTTDVAGASANNIRFFSCHICSLTFIQENYYNQHMETHRRGDATTNTATTTASTHKKTSNTVVGNNSLSTLNAAALLSEAAQQDTNEMVHHNTDLNVHHQQQHQQHQQQQQQQQQQQTATMGNAGNNTISEADIESIFEKMHSDKGDAGVTATTTSSGNGGGSNDQVVITSQAGSGGGITFNITIPGQEGGGVVSTSEDHTTNTTTTTTAPVSVSIDMPMLDQPDDSTHASTTTTTTTTTASTNLKAESPKPTSAGPVSMPSLDDDNEEQQQQPATNPSSENSKNMEEPAQHNAEESTATPSNQPATDDGTTKTEESSANNHQNEQQVEDQSALENTATTDNQQTESAIGDESHHQQQLQQQHEVSEAGGEQQQQQTHEHHEMTAGSEGGGGAEGEQQQHVAMELDEAAMQAQVDGGQIKFILNESGQLLQLDNHILTDADGNQILVQDPEHIQQLLQSVGVLQSGEGLDGETLQMMTDANGQMVLVQGENNETQLIDASLLNADGQLVIQQSQDGDGGAHVIGEDGTRIPVSVSYTEDGQPIVQVQQQVLEAATGGGEDDGVMEKDATGVEGTAQAGGTDKIAISSD
ncbi:serine-rich adhesin for platelets isoform X2 [Calliphora vicina]|uniref:serine-rich adhesin for platelets isoform X2 n=1 Tax=Calliphora vicina TaxID=7373 RepID=UPI00325AC20C